MNRVGLGQDSHVVIKSEKRPMVLGGVVVRSGLSLKGNSDADVILHSLFNALSSAIGGDSISTVADDMLEKEKIKDSQKYVSKIYEKIRAEKYKVENISVSVEAGEPRVSLSDIGKMKENISSLLQIGVQQVGITFTSGEGLTPFGQGKGIKSMCAVLLSK